jgi:hypothetical protein
MIHSREESADGLLSFHPRQTEEILLIHSRAESADENFSFHPRQTGEFFLCEIRKRSDLPKIESNWRIFMIVSASIVLCSAILFLARIKEERSELLNKAAVLPPWIKCESGKDPFSSEAKWCHFIKVWEDRKEFVLST